MYKQIFFAVSLTSLAILAESCKTTQSAESASLTLQLDELAEATLGKPYEIVMNENQSHALVLKSLKTRPNDAYPSLRFFIYDMKANKSIYENTEPGGEALWESKDVVKVISYTGIPNPEQNSNGMKTYRYNVKTKKKYTGGLKKRTN